MKLRNHHYILIGFLLVTLAMGCKKWLDVSPKTQIRERELLEDEQGYLDALTGAYLKMGSGKLYGQNMTMFFVDLLGQVYNTSSDYTAYGKYQYEDASVKSTISDIWEEGYATLANLDNILVQIDADKNVFTGDNYQRIKGQALALRAYIHFDLLRLFGTAPVVDGNKKSIPYLTTFGVETYPLLSVNAVIDSCLKDLENAEILLSGDKTVDIRQSTAPTSNFMNYWAIKGLQARIYLYGGNKQAANAAAMEVINHQQLFPFVEQSAASVTTNRDRLYATEHLFALNVYHLKSYTEYYTKTNVVGATPSLHTTTSKLKNLYEISSGGSSDIRFNYLFAQYGGGYSTTKYWQDDIVDNPNVAYLKNIVPLIRISEMYYIAAECAADPATGVLYLNTIREARGLAPLDAGISADNLQEEILKEYKKEFYAEGQLFYYFKRKNSPRIDGSSADATQVYVLPLPEDEVEFGKRF